MSSLKMTRIRISKLATLAAAIAAAATATIAASAHALAGDKPGGPGPPGEPISWEEMMERCLHPRQFDIQAPPENIKMQCSETRLVWTVAASGDVVLPGNRLIVSSVFSDKFFVDEEEISVPISSKAGSCPRFKQVQETVTIERPVTCPQLVAIKGDLNEFCASVVDAAKGSNPKLVDVRETGRLIDTCGDVDPRKSR